MTKRHADRDPKSGKFVKGGQPASGDSPPDRVGQVKPSKPAPRKKTDRPPQDPPVTDPPAGDEKYPLDMFCGGLIIEL